jgi:hypothetical protein
VVRGPVASLPHFSFPCRAEVVRRPEHFSVSACQLFPDPDFARTPNRHLFRNFVLTPTRVEPFFYLEIVEAVLGGSGGNGSGRKISKSASNTRASKGCVH